MNEELLAPIQEILKEAELRLASVLPDAVFCFAVRDRDTGFALLQNLDPFSGILLTEAVIGATKNAVTQSAISQAADMPDLDGDSQSALSNLPVLPVLTLG